jgi:hypothetical protein
MTVNLILGAIGGAFTLAILAAVTWALTRPQDRIQMASVCLFGCAALYFLVAMQVFGSNPALGLLVGGYSLLVYAVLGAFAVFNKPWAWKASIAAFGVHCLLTLGVAFIAIQVGKVAWLALLVWLGLGAMGLYASLHKGSRQIILGHGASEA